MLIRMELARIIISEVNDHQVIYLRESEPNVERERRKFPILIGFFEANMIKQRIQGLMTPRPLTHDLVVNVVEEMDGELEDVWELKSQDKRIHVVPFASVESTPSNITVDV